MVRLFVWMAAARCVGGMGGLDLTAGALGVVVSRLSMYLKLEREFYGR